MSKHLSRLGFGVGFRAPHYSWVIENQPRVDWFEIISENFIAGGGRPRRFLAQLKEIYPVVMHGVSLSIASPQPLRTDYLRELKKLADWLNPALLSDHLCWTRMSAHNSHDLLPVPYTGTMLRHVQEKVNHVQDYLGRRLLLENPSAYVGFTANEMGEAAFFHELCRTTGCGMVLDLNNLFVNSCNLGVDADAYLATLGRDHVYQFHLGGHSIEGEVRIDTHDQPVPSEAWELYRKALRIWPHAATLVEWDAKIPEFQRLQAECDFARKLATDVEREYPVSEKGPSFQVSSSELLATAPVFAHEVTTGSDYLAQSSFFSLVTVPGSLREGAPELHTLQDDLPVSAFRGARVYASGYFLRLAECLRETFPALAFVCGDDGMEFLTAVFLEECPPNEDSIKYAGLGLEKFLRARSLDFDFGVPQSVLADIVALEWAKADVYDLPDYGAALLPSVLQDVPVAAWPSVRIRCSGTMRLLRLGCDAGFVIDTVEKGEPPLRPTSGDFQYLVFRAGEDACHLALDTEVAEVIERFLIGSSFGEVCEELTERGGLEMQEAAVRVVGGLKQLLECGLVLELRTADSAA